MPGRRGQARSGALVLGVAIAGALAAVPGGPGAAGPTTAEARERLVVREVVGEPRRVAPRDFGVAHARCPRGSVAIAGGLYLGAMEPVADFRAKPRVWKSDAFNPSSFTPFSHAVQAICLQGRGIRVRGVSQSGGGRRAATAGADASRPSVAEMRRAFAKGARYPSSPQ